MEKIALKEIKILRIVSFWVNIAMYTGENNNLKGWGGIWNNLLTNCRIQFKSLMTEYPDLIQILNTTNQTKQAMIKVFKEAVSKPDCVRPSVGD